MLGRTKTGLPCVALRKESVDRNVLLDNGSHEGRNVALRKESVDRNKFRPVNIAGQRVALRKESVDRNASKNRTGNVGFCGRSPQGERG